LPSLHRYLLLGAKLTAHELHRGPTATLVLSS
jgi:hypothetical protein